MQKNSDKQKCILYIKNVVPQIHFAILYFIIFTLGDKKEDESSFSRNVT